VTSLLHVDSSIRHDGSTSRTLAAQFAQTWLQGGADRTVVYRDLTVTPPPHLSWDAFTAAMTPAGDHTEEQSSAAKAREELIVELESADALLLSSPMYNYSIPSALKAWIDNVIVMSRTAGRPDGTGALTGKPVTVVLSRGGGYGPGTPRAAWNHQEAYLRHVLEALGADDIHIVAAELTLASSNPAMVGLVGAAEESLAAAERAVAGRAAA
jgi:FMN-dependent NADH-azoreductase